MRDVVLYLHIIFGLAIIMFSILVLLELKRPSKLIKVYSIAALSLGWLLLIPAAVLYILFYPATKTLIKAGTIPWAHSIIMETKEHWGLLVPIIATTAAGLVLTGRAKESKRWWILLLVITVLIGMMGRIVTSGGMAR